MSGSIQVGRDSICASLVAMGFKRETAQRAAQIEDTVAAAAEWCMANEEAKAAEQRSGRAYRESSESTASELFAQAQAAQREASRAMAAAQAQAARAQAQMQAANAMASTSAPPPSHNPYSQDNYTTLRQYSDRARESLRRESGFAPCAAASAAAPTAVPPLAPPKPATTTVPPDARLTSELQAMGFELQLALEAQKRTCNDPGAAVQWLTGPEAVAFARRLKQSRQQQGMLAGTDPRDQHVDIGGVVMGTAGGGFKEDSDARADLSTGTSIQRDMGMESILVASIEPIVHGIADPGVAGAAVEEVEALPMHMLALDRTLTKEGREAQFFRLMREQRSAENEASQNRLQRLSARSREKEEQRMEQESEHDRKRSIHLQRTLNTYNNNRKGSLAREVGRGRGRGRGLGLDRKRSSAAQVGAGGAGGQDETESGNII